MSTLEIEETFSTPAPPTDVLAFLLDPEKLVDCLPGAELEAIESERVFHGRVRVKVGAVTIGYRGRIELTEVDEATGTIRAEGEGREKGGAGKVRLELTGRIEAEGDGSRVEVTARVKLAGKIVRFGRGLLEAVAVELFREFALAVSERVGASPAHDALAPGKAPAAPEVPAAPEAPAAPRKRQAPIRALPLLLRSIWSWVRGLFGARS